MIPRAEENKMLRPAEMKAGRCAEPARGSTMCPGCGAWLEACGDRDICPHCRVRVRMGLVP